jgi:hypothetical protein
MCVTNTTLRRLAIQPISLRPLGPIIHADAGQRPIEIGSIDEVAPTSFSASPPDALATASLALEQDDKASRPKRRRKPQKPGLTAKNQERHFVVHNYHDHAGDTPQEMVASEGSCGSSSGGGEHRRRGGIAVSFPAKLHVVLDQIALDGYDHVISWQPHGRAFAIHQPKVFTEKVMPKYFRQSKLTSFQRQLNLYGFQRLTRGADAGAYYSELFLRGKPFLCQSMVRTKVKGTKYKSASSPEQEPNFYDMAPVSPNYTPQQQLTVRASEVVTPHPPSPPPVRDTNTSQEPVQPSVISANQQHETDETAAFSSASAYALSPSSSASFDFTIPPEAVLPWEQHDGQQHGQQRRNTFSCLSDSDLQSVIDDALVTMVDADDDEVETLSPEEVDFCATWDPVAPDDLDQIQAVLASDDKLDEMIGMLLRD